MQKFAEYECALILCLSIISIKNHFRIGVGGITDSENHRISPNNCSATAVLKPKSLFRLTNFRLNSSNDIKVTDTIVEESCKSFNFYSW